MKVIINKSFIDFPERKARRVVLPVSCEALVQNDIVIINHPYGHVTVTIDRFQNLIQNNVIKVISKS